MNPRLPSLLLISLGLVAPLLLSAGRRVEACAGAERRVLVENATASQVQDEVMRLKETLARVSQYSLALAGIHALWYDPSIDFRLLLDTTLLIPTDSAILSAEIPTSNITYTDVVDVLKMHVLPRRRAYSKVECGEPMPFLLTPANWTWPTLGGVLLTRMVPPGDCVRLSPTVFESEYYAADIVNPSLFVGKYFAAHGVNKLLRPPYSY
ncbi:hypothetical protein CLOM_g24037 [Closterium sp. NIES-68]|nr:hypothetical protein CLOM_g24037 [Closterium sp. NIES-68]GJP85305.1 hypothetical protein CLOP_g15415 [Closterium sp. NIES-67]